MEKAFSTADSDKDGKLSVAELPMAVKEFQSLSEAEVEDAEHQQDSDDMDGKEDEFPSEDMPEDMMQEMDKDKDGYLSLVELMPEADGEIDEKETKLIEKAFNAADSDKDGKLSVAELPVTMKEAESLLKTVGEGENL